MSVLEFFQDAANKIDPAYLKVKQEPISPKEKEKVAQMEEVLTLEEDDGTIWSDEEEDARLLLAIHNSKVTNYEECRARHESQSEALVGGPPKLLPSSSSLPSVSSTPVPISTSTPAGSAAQSQDSNPETVNAAPMQEPSAQETLKPAEEEASSQTSASDKKKGGGPVKRSKKERWVINPKFRNYRYTSARLQL